MHDRLREEMRYHFHQATKVAFATRGLNTKLREIILSSNPEQWEQQVRDLEEWPLSSEFQMPSPVEYAISKEDLIDGFRKWREETSTSPSNRHLGIYKILTQKDHKDEEEEGLQDYFASIFADVINLAVDAGVVLPRWCKVNSVLIPKDEGSSRIHRFRTINLYEADLNLAVRVMVAKRVSKNVENLGLGDEQWGGRSGRSATDIGLSTTLTLDHGRLTRRPLGYVDLDAASCYDPAINYM